MTKGLRNSEAPFFVFWWYLYCCNSGSVEIHCGEQCFKNLFYLSFLCGLRSSLATLRLAHVTAYNGNIRQNTGTVENCE